jgi:hypothetical protein
VSYVPVGYRTLAASADTTGLNAGNLTNAFTPQQLNVTVGIFEVYHIVIQSGTPGATFTPAPCTVYLDGHPYTFTFPAGGTEWDPAQPMEVRNGQEVDFCWGLASTATPVPVVTLYMRYDPALIGNVNG